MLRIVENEPNGNPEAQMSLDEIACMSSKRFGLEMSGMMREKAPYRYQFSWDREAGASHSTTLPSDDTIAAFLHRMRPFLLENEETFFNRVIRRLGKRFPQPAARRYFRRLRDVFEARGMGTVTTTTPDGRTLSHRSILRMWLNAFEYHRDAGLQEELSFLRKQIPDEAVRAIMVQFLSQKAIAIRKLAKFIHAIGAPDGPPVEL